MTLLKSLIAIMLAAYLCYGNCLFALILLPYVPICLYKAGRNLAEKRRWSLNMSFSDAIMCISSSLEAGYSIENAVSEAYKDLCLSYDEQDIIMRELKEIINKIKNNIPVETCFSSLAERSGLEDIESFADVFATAKRTGGNIIAIIRSTSGVIRTRVELKRELRTAIASKKYESNVMKIIPFAVLAYLRVFSPDMISALYLTGGGRILMTGLLIAYVGLCELSDRIVRIEL